MKKLEGNFQIVNGKLDFNCITEGITFEEVKAGLIKLRDELNRQIEHQNKCPFHQSTHIVSSTKK